MRVDVSLKRLLVGADGKLSPLFDRDWYRRRYREVAAAGIDPELHFLEHGTALGHRPNPLFDPDWYLSRHPEVGRAGLDPFAHFLTLGERSGLRPDPLFHTVWYRERHARELAELGLSPLAHYLGVGSSRGEWPNPLFDPDFYVRAHGLPVEPGFQPLAHYLEWGAMAGLDPHPLFDTDWYLARHPEVARSGENPLAHFLDHGGEAGCSPHPFFDAAWYRERHPEAAGRNPLVYFLEEGAGRGHRPHPLFDTRWYLERHPRVARGGGNPLMHFVTEGAARGAAANPLFDPAWYSLQQPGIDASRDPFRHHVEHLEGSLPSPSFLRYARFFLPSEQAPELEDLEENPVLAYREAGRLVGMAPAPEPVFPDAPDPEVSIVIPVFDQAPHTIACLRSLAAARTRARYEVVVVDDASARVDYPKLLARIPRLRVLRNERNLGFVSSCNRGAREAQGRHLLFLNNDTIATDGWLDELLDTFRKFPATGVAGSKLVFPNGLVAEAGGIVWRDGTAWNYGRRRDPRWVELDYAREVDYVSGASLMIPKELFEALGGFDEKFSPAYYEDTDLAFRVRKAGYRVVYQPASEVIHFEGVSSGTDVAKGVKSHQVSHRKFFLERWGEALQGHRLAGESPDLEKDRASPRRALVIDVCTPTPARDARSLRLFHAMRILRDLGFRVSFVPENLTAPDPFHRQLRSHGIRVLASPQVGALPALLARDGEAFDLCWICRPGVATRWLERVRERCPDATVLVDVADLVEPRTLVGQLERGRGGVAGIGSLADRAHVVLVDVEPGSSEVAGLEASAGVRVLSRIHDVSEPRAPFASRADLLFLASFHAASSVDSLLWLTEEILPSIAKTAPGLLLHVPECSWSRVLAAGRPQIAVLPEEEMARPGWLDRFRVAVATPRFGPGLAGRLQPALASGLPCVVTSPAARGLTSEARAIVRIADSSDDLGRAIVRLCSDQGEWERTSQAARARVAPLFAYDSAKARLAGILSGLGLGPPAGSGAAP